MKIQKLLAMFLIIAMITTLMPVTMIDNAATNDAIVFQKVLTPAGNGQPTRIKLEAYVEGTVSALSEGRPTDIIMVLDQSGSMDDSITVSGGQSSSKLAVMKDAVQTFAEEVSELNTAGDGRYRMAIVGFASADSNTEILTVGKSKTQIENNAEYSYMEVNGNSLDENENYYIASENGYTEIYYYDGLFNSGWCYGEWYDRTEVNVSNTTVYSRTIVGYPDYSDKSAWYYLAVQEATNSHDYEMKNHIYEKWTALREVTDWTKYE